MMENGGDGGLSDLNRLVDDMNAINSVMDSIEDRGDALEAQLTSFLEMLRSQRQQQQQGHIDDGDGAEVDNKGNKSNSSSSQTSSVPDGAALMDVMNESMRLISDFQDTKESIDKLNDKINVPIVSLDEQEMQQVEPQVEVEETVVVAVVEESKETNQ
eukprot:m.243784 g.243784  ORF g.243784 m.243784 type:complete len:158 (+) comp47859_c0_seq1:92-565(+)